MLTYDRGTEFMAEFAEMIEKDLNKRNHSQKSTSASKCNYWNGVHQTIGNIIQMFSKNNLDEIDPWGGILVATMFAVWATYHNTM
jgi:hypothetical protein